jgi:hypothetical protein
MQQSSIFLDPDQEVESVTGYSPSARLMLPHYSVARRNDEKQPNLFVAIWGGLLGLRLRFNSNSLDESRSTRSTISSSGFGLSQT